MSSAVRFAVGEYALWQHGTQAEGAIRHADRTKPARPGRRGDRRGGGPRGSGSRGAAFYFWQGAPPVVRIPILFWRSAIRRRDRAIGRGAG